MDDEGEARPKPKANIVESLGGEEGISVANISNIVQNRVGNILGKGIGGLGAKFGGGSWF